MPLDMISMGHRLGAEDGATQFTAAVRTLARPHDEASVASSGECGPFAQAAIATIDDIRYASELRSQLRDRYLGRPEPLIRPWCVGAD